MGEEGRREVAEMIRCWGGDEGATLVAARRTTTLGRCNLPLKPMSRNDVGFCRGMMGSSGGDLFLTGGGFRRGGGFPESCDFMLLVFRLLGFSPWRGAAPIA
jgi:hypothetical protein